MAGTDVACAQGGVRFSVFLAPAPSASSPEAGEKLAVVRDLHYAVGERDIPIYLKQGRQSIEYPWRGNGRNLVLFRLEQGEFLTAVTLYSQGVADPDRQRDLEKDLPKEPEQP